MMPAKLLSETQCLQRELTSHNHRHRILFINILCILLHLNNLTLEDILSSSSIVPVSLVILKKSNHITIYFKSSLLSPGSDTVLQMVKYWRRR